MGVDSGTNSFSKEISLQKKIARIYNKREEDFPSLRDYNDYLEEVEDITFNLIEGIDVVATEAKIEKYRIENAEQIINAEARKAEELAAALIAERKGHSLQTDIADLGVQTSQGAVGGVSVQGQYAPAAIPGSGLGQPRPTQPLPIGGHIDPLRGYAADDEDVMKLRADRAAKAGGWAVEISRKRALEETFSSIWI